MKRLRMVNGTDCECRLGCLHGCVYDSVRIVQGCIVSNSDMREY